MERRALFLKSIVIAICAASLFCSAAFGQRRSKDEQAWMRGYEGLNLIVASHGLEHISRSQWLSISPKQTMLIVLGTPSVPKDINRYLREGGAVLLANDQRSNAASRSGFRFHNLYSNAIFRQDHFEGHADCPIVTDFLTPDHPVLKNVSRIIANRPGAISVSSGFVDGEQRCLARLPSYGNHNRYGFIWTLERPDSRLMCIGDPSVFSNQMLMHGDNAVFAKQAVQWCKGSGRTKVLVLDNGAERFPVDLNEMEVELPPPSRDEVVEALKNLPPSMLLEFGNAVASVLEDENMLNEFATSVADDIRPKAMNRFLIFLAFAAACLFSFVVFSNQKRIRQKTASGVAVDLEKAKKRTSKAQEQIERQMAVEAMLDSFCVDVASKRYKSWVDFPKALEVSDAPGTNAMLIAMDNTHKLYHSKPPTYWTQKRLLETENEIDQWRGFFGLAPLRARPPKQT